MKKCGIDNISTGSKFNTLLLLLPFRVTLSIDHQLKAIKGGWGQFVAVLKTSSLSVSPIQDLPAS